MWPLWFAAVLICLARASQGSCEADDAQVAPWQTGELNNPGADDFLRRSSLTTTRLGNHLYVDGGRVYRLANGKEEDYLVNITLSIPLDRSWSNRSLVMGQAERSPLPSLFKPILWADPEAMTLYSYGGDATGENKDYTARRQLWKLTPDPLAGLDSPNGNIKWQKSYPANEADFSKLYNPGRSLHVVCNGVAFSLGGFVNGNTDDRFAGSGAPLPGMVTYNFSTRTWHNETITKVFTGLGPVPYFPGGGNAICLPDLGTAGTVMFMGGYGASAAAESSVSMPLSNLTFFDIAERKWRWQTARGSLSSGVPRGRREACAAISKGRNGTYEVFLYGGVPTENTKDPLWGDLWILTMPGFHWFEVPAAATQPGRGFTSCAAAGRQLVVVGGVAEISHTPGTLDKRDPWAQGVGVFDMSELAWRDSYDAGAAEYDSPQVVQNWHRTDGETHWDNGGMQTLFSGTATSIPPSSTDPAAAAPSSSDTSQGVTIGVAVGCSVLALAIGGTLAWLCICHQRRQQQRKGISPEELEGPSSFRLRPKLAPAGGGISSWTKSDLSSGRGGAQPYQQRAWVPELRGSEPLPHEAPTDDTHLPPLEMVAPDLRLGPHEVHGLSARRDGVCPAHQQRN